MNSKLRTSGNWAPLGFAAILLLAVTNPLAAQSTASTRALQRLTNDLALQLDLTYRHDKATHLQRYDEMAEAIAAWNRSLRTDADYALMEHWLREAIRNSMPGAGKALPGPPEFFTPRSTVAEMPTPHPVPPQSKTGVVKPQGTAPAPNLPQPKSERRPPVVAEPIPPAPTKRVDGDFWSEHPAARPLDTGNPFRDDPASRPEPTKVAGAEPPTARAAMRLPVIEAAEVGVNLPELSSRIGGYNQALRRIEATVIAAGKPNARELAKLLSELERLTDQRDFIDLYLVGLSAQERRSTPKLHSADAALGLIEEKVAARLNSSAAANNSTERDILQALVRKLAELQHGLPATP